AHVLENMITIFRLAVACRCVAGGIRRLNGAKGDAGLPGLADVAVGDDEAFADRHVGDFQAASEVAFGGELVGVAFFAEEVEVPALAAGLERAGAAARNADAAVAGGDDDDVAACVGIGDAGVVDALDVDAADGPQGGPA